MSRIFCCTRGSFNSRWPAGSRLITLRMRKPSGVGMTGETPPCGRETTALRNSGVTRSRSLWRTNPGLAQLRGDALQIALAHEPHVAAVGRRIGIFRVVLRQQAEIHALAQLRRDS